MILRKPYKFLIKNFKLIHLILTILMVYIVYRFSRIVNFFGVAISSYTGVLTTNPTAALFDIYIYLSIFLIIILSLVLIFLLYMKKKPIKLYISTIVVYLAAFILIAYAYNVIGNMEVKIVDVKILRNTKDFLVMISMVQVVQIVLYGIRALGLDIKNFNFKEDLKEFEIVNEDNEEFELNVNVDVNKMHRHVNKGRRFLKYYYVENRYLFFFVSSLSVCIICLIIYLSLGVYNKKYTQTEFFTTQDFTLAISNSYITDLDYDGNTISDDISFVILEFTIKTNGKKNKQINLARPELIVGYNKYYHNNDYITSFVDIGKVYNNEEIGNEFVKYLMVYPIDKNDSNKKMFFRYVDDTSISSAEAKSIEVEIKTRNLDKLKGTKNYKLGDTIDFSDSILNDTKFVVNDKTISDLFKVNYNFCFNNSECYPSVEYLKPSIVNNYDKTLIRLNGKIEWSSETAKSKLTNLFKFIDMYGSVKYKIDGVEKQDFTILKQVKSKRLNEKDTYYLEIVKEIENAQELYIEFKVRDYIYIYKLI